MVPVSDPLGPMEFSDVPPLPDDAPDFRASQDGPSPAPPLPGDGSSTPEPPRRRRLPGRDGPVFGKTSQTKQTKPPREPRPNVPMAPGPKGFAPAIEKTYHNLALAVTPFDVELGEQLHNIAAEAADAWNELAKRNQAVRRFIVYITETTAWGAVVAAHSPIIGLMFARLMGEQKRTSLLQMFSVAAEAERYANEQNNGHGESGNEAA
jgi:hypothetical protein